MPRAKQYALTQKTVKYLGEPHNNSQVSGQLPANIMLFSLGVEKDKLGKSFGNTKRRSKQHYFCGRQNVQFKDFQLF